MTEKYEARAYIKFKEEGKEDKEKREAIESAREFVKLMSQLLFEKALREVYDEGMRSKYPSAELMLRLTDFFVSCTASFYMGRMSEEEIIKDIEVFLDSVKHDTIETIKQVFEMRREFKS